MNRTDLAEEIVSNGTIAQGIKHCRFKLRGIELSEIIIDETGEKACGKPRGSYVTVFCGEGREQAQIAALTTVIRRYTDGKKRFLVACLGNPSVTPDSLGHKAAVCCAATGHFTSCREFDELEMNEVYVFETGVLAQTGVESGRQIRLLAEELKPELVIAVDSLACSERDRLCATVQVTDSGIAPGSGVGNSRAALNQETLGVPCIAIGVPTIIDYHTEREPLMVTPRSIDAEVAYYGKVIGTALNRALLPMLSDSEIVQLKR